MAQWATEIDLIVASPYRFLPVALLFSNGGGLTEPNGRIIHLEPHNDEAAVGGRALLARQQRHMFRHLRSRPYPDQQMRGRPPRNMGEIQEEELGSNGSGTSLRQPLLRF